MTPTDPVAQIRHDLACEHLDDLRHLDAQMRSSKRRLEAAVRASGTTVTDIFGVGPVVAAMVIGHTRNIDRFADRDHFAAYAGTARSELAIATPDRAFCVGVWSSIAKVEIKMLIRVAEAGDIEAVEAIRYAALSASAPSVYSPREVGELLDDIDLDELRAMVKDRQLFVAETEGLTVGCAGWRGEYLRHVYVAPESERGGLGTRLVTRAESDFRDRTSAAEIHVGSVLYARRFYEKLGYELVTEDRAGSEPFQMKKGFAATSPDPMTADRALE